MILLSQPERIGPLLTDSLKQIKKRNSWTILDWTSKILLKVELALQNKQDVLNLQHC